MPPKQQQTPKRTPQQPRKRWRKQRTQLINNPRWVGLPLTQVIRNRAIVFTPTVQVTNTVYPASGVAVPLSLVGIRLAGLTWLAQVMDLYDEFRFKRIRLEFSPILSLTCTGAQAVYYDVDTHPQVPTLFSQISGNYGARSTQVYRPIKVNIDPKRLTRLPWYQTHETDNTSIQGNLVFVQTAGSVPNATGTVSLGLWWMDYEIELRNPSRPDQPTSRASEPELDLLPNQEIMELQTLREKLTEQLELLTNKLDVKLSTLAGTGVQDAIANATAATANSLETTVRILNQMSSIQQNSNSLLKNRMSQQFPQLVEKLNGSDGAMYFEPHDKRWKVAVKNNAITRALTPSSEVEEGIE